MTADRPRSPLPPALWSRRRPTAMRDSFDDVDTDRLMVFVPAIMSVGLVFSVATVLRDLVRRSGGRARRRRTAIEANYVAATVLGETDPADPEDTGILSRPSYLLSALILVGGAAYISIGSTANFLRDGGPVRDIGWLLALSLGLSVLLGFLGAVALATFVAWPHPPPWALGSLRVTPLSVTPGTRSLGPPFVLGVGVWGAAVGLGIVVLMVGSGRGVTGQIDGPIANWLVEVEWLDRLEGFDWFGSTGITLAFVCAVGLAAVRCRVMALLYPAVFLVSWLTTLVLLEIIERPRPLGLDDDAFPSGHMVQAVLLAGLVPLAIFVLTGEQRFAIVARVVLGTAVVAAGLDRIHRQEHWPLDVLAGTLLGLTGVLATHWIIAHRFWHQRCASCPWSGHPGHTPWEEGVFDLNPYTVRLLGRVGGGLAVVASVALIVGTVTVGIPVDPEGSGFGSSISTPIQVGLALVVGVAGITSFRWRARSAVAIALAASGLGVFASIEYSVIITVALTVALTVPAILLWLSWQVRETWGRIATLAVTTALMVTGTAAGSLAVHDHYYGPTHPDSVATTAFAEADWLWLGAVTDRSATVVGAGFDRGEDAVLLLGDPQDPAGRLDAVADGYGVVRFELSGLAPDTPHAYTVLAAGSEPPVQADAVFTTQRIGTSDLVVALSSCARSGSNAAVYDAIWAADPDLFLAIGDLHYGNLESTDPAVHLAQYRRAIGNPGPARVFSSIPTAYVWDDHDYGPNDADGSSPSRAAVSVAYRAAVPAYGVSPDPADPINQAFTLGDVRFVLTDTRSHRSPESMLGEEQRAWLIEEILDASARHELIVWVNPTPWISDDGLASDNWSAHPDERATISDALAGVDNLVMVSGDAHMVAIDDGTNSRYGSDESGGFPVLHAAAIDRPGSIKGGPYSEGAFPGGGQFGLLEVRHTRDGLEVRLSGHDWDGQELVSYVFKPGS